MKPKVTFTSYDPYNSKIVGKTIGFDEENIQKSIEYAHNSFINWRAVDLGTRLTYVSNLRTILLEHKEEWGTMISREMGKPLKESIAEIEKCAELCTYYTENAKNFLADEEIKTEANTSYVRFDPLGVILGIMPWNFPFWQVMRFAVPALIAGNTVVVKHASNVQLSAKNIETAFDKAGFPKGVFVNLPIDSEQTKSIIAHPKIRGVSFTGSEEAGRSVAETAGKHLKPTVLELGGSNALVVLNDCDIEKTAKVCVQARFQNNGQSCIAGKRLFVQKEIAAEFLNALRNEVQALQEGDPMNSDVKITSLAKDDFADELEKQVLDTLGDPPTTDFVWQKDEASIAPNLAEVKSTDETLMQEETFGPFLPYHIFEHVNEIPDLVNSTGFGLGVSLFTKDISMAKKLIPILDEGAVFVNAMVKSNPALPFGGVKNSGIGRELGEYGLKSFVNIKTIWIEK